MNKLTKKQRAVYDTIIRLTAENGYPPSGKQLQATIGCASLSTVQSHLNALQKKGWVTWEPNKTRTLATLNPRGEA